MNPKIEKFEDLVVWQLARELCKQIHQLCRDERFKQDLSLKYQILKSSGSVMDNIAEGFERDGNREFRQFLYIAKGSLGEVRSQVYRLYDKLFIDESILNELIENCKKLSVKIKNLISTLDNSNLQGTKYK